MAVYTIKARMRQNRWQKNKYSTDPEFRQKCLDYQTAYRAKKKALQPPKPPREPVVKKKCATRAEYLKEWFRLHPEKRKEYYNRWKLNTTKTMRKLSQEKKDVKRREWLDKHPEKRKKYTDQVREYREKKRANPETREEMNKRVRERQKARYRHDEEYRELRKAKALEYYYSHRDECRRRQQEYKSKRK